MSRDYQRQRNNKYLLPNTVYHKTIWTIRDYYRVKESLNSLADTSAGIAYDKDKVQTSGNADTVSMPPSSTVRPSIRSRPSTKLEPRCQRNMSRESGTTCSFAVASRLMQTALPMDVLRANLYTMLQRALALSNLQHRGKISVVIL